MSNVLFRRVLETKKDDKTKILKMSIARFTNKILNECKCIILNTWRFKIM